MASRREYWLNERRRVLDELRNREPDLVRDLEACEAALEKYGEEPEAPSDEYARYGLAWQAVVAYLEKRSRTAEEELIIDAVLKGGWLRGNDRADVNLKNSIGYMLRNSKKKQLIKKFPSGKIGLYSWTADYDRR